MKLRHRLSEFFVRNLIRIARNTSNAKLLDMLASNKHVRVRWSVAGNEYTHMQTLHNLAYDPDWHVRVKVASNPATNSLDLDRLASDESSYVRFTVKQALQARKS